MKKILALVLTLALCTGALAGCGSTAPSASGEASPAASPAASSTAASSEAPATPAAEGEHYKFGYTCMTMNNPFFTTLEQAIRTDVEANGDTLITTNPQMDVALQINQIEDMITQGIQAIFLNPVDWEGIRPALDMLKEANVKIINFDTEVKDFEYVDAYVGSDNKNAGFVCGEDLVKRFPDGGNIIILESPTMNSVNDRIAGFEEAIKDKGFTVVARQDAKGDLQTSMTICEDILQAHGDAIAIMGGNDPTALGALAACQAAGIKEILIYGVDGSPDIKKELAKSDTLISGTGAQSPVNIGKLSVKVAYQILKGETFEKRTPVETFLINKDNVAEYGTDGWQ